MIDLKYLIENKAVCNKLLFELNQIAIDYSVNEYGLPMFDGGLREQMREAIYNWVASIPTSKE